MIKSKFILKFEKMCPLRSILSLHIAFSPLRRNGARPTRRLRQQPIRLRTDHDLGAGPTARTIRRNTLPIIKCLGMLSLGRSIALRLSDGAGT